MLKKFLLLSCLITGSVQALHAQAAATASKLADLQAGGTFVFANSDYYPQKFKGFGIYSTFDFRRHLGIEADFHQADGRENVYERTYEIGARYVLHYGRLHPYGKFLVGRGVFNFPPALPGGPAAANLAYNLYAFGGGADYSLRRSINLRGDFEYQQWPSFPPNGLSPYVISVGAAYHFH